MYTAKVAVCSEIRMKHSMQSKNHAEFWNVKTWWNVMKPPGFKGYNTAITGKKKCDKRHCTNRSNLRSICTQTKCNFPNSLPQRITAERYSATQHTAVCSDRIPTPCLY
jgi:hypothetical protein